MLFSCNPELSRLYLCLRVIKPSTFILFTFSCESSATMAIFDAMQLCTAPISTVVFGLAASTAALVAAGGSKGMRFAMPNARIMMHQPLGGASGQAIDVEIQAKEIMYHKTNIVRIMSEITGRTPQQVREYGGNRL